MKIHNLVPGSPEWHEFRGRSLGGASEAAAMLGLSPYVKRTELLRAKKTGLPREYSEWFQSKVLDKGHEVEALARPHMEAIVGDDLYPVTCSDGELHASCDGLTFESRIAAEHKQWSESLVVRMSRGEMPEEHIPQCQQVLMVTGAEKLLFVVSDGTAENMRHCWVLPDPAWFQRLRDGWAQFKRDLDAYVPPVIAEPARAEPMESLPAVSVRLDGALSVAGNLPAFSEALRAFIARMPVKPATDNDFATTEAACKALKKAEEALDAAEAGALASITDVEAMRRAVADCRKLARDTRLAAEKMVERRKTEVKEGAVANARKALDAHIADLNGELAPMRLQPVAADFAGAIKGLRSIASMQDALDTALANGKIAADAQARLIRANVATFKGAAAGLEFLFSDLSQIVHKAADDFAVLVSARITTHRAAEAERERKRKADEEARIAAEAQRLADEQIRQAQEAVRQAAAGASTIAADAQRAEWARLEAAALAARAQQSTTQPGSAGGQVDGRRAPESHPAGCSGPGPQDHTSLPASPTPATVKESLPVARRDEPATLKLGDICNRLGFTMSAAFIADVLHVKPARTDGRSLLYTESQYLTICRQLQIHVGAMAEMYAGEPA